MPQPKHPSSSPVPVGHFRWTICALLFLATTINYMDRQILGILAPTLQKEIGWILKTTGSYWSLFLMAGSAYLLALALMHALSPRLNPIQDSGQRISFRVG